MTLDELIEELKRVKHVMQDENDGKGIGHYEIVTEGCDCDGDVHSIEIHPKVGTERFVYLKRMTEEERKLQSQARDNQAREAAEAERLRDMEKFGSEAALLPE